jgi:hypothetical protein
VSTVEEELVAFVRARLDERGQHARIASPWPWHLGPEGDEVIAADGILVAEVFALSSNQQRNTAAFIVRCDPKQALADVAAMRVILDEHTHHRSHYNPVEIACGTCASDRHETYYEVNGWCKTVRLLALPFDWHPGYREAWRP